MLYSLLTDIVNKPQKQTNKQHSKLFRLPYGLCNTTHDVELSEEIPSSHTWIFAQLLLIRDFPCFIISKVVYPYHFCTDISYFPPYTATVLGRMRIIITQACVFSNLWESGTASFSRSILAKGHPISTDIHQRLSSHDGQTARNAGVWVEEHWGRLAAQHPAGSTTGNTGQSLEGQYVVLRS